MVKCDASSRNTSSWENSYGDCHSTNHRKRSTRYNTHWDDPWTSLDDASFSCSRRQYFISFLYALRCLEAMSICFARQATRDLISLTQKSTTSWSSLLWGHAVGLLVLLVEGLLAAWGGQGAAAVNAASCSAAHRSFISALGSIGAAFVLDFLASHCTGSMGVVFLLLHCVCSPAEAFGTFLGIFFFKESAFLGPCRPNLFWGLTREGCGGGALPLVRGIMLLAPSAALSSSSDEGSGKWNIDSDATSQQ